MTNMAIIRDCIVDGNASRLIKNKWFVREILSTEAFDLRDREPPETYVSHILANGNSLDDQFQHSLNELKKRMARVNGFIAIICIDTALREINDEESQIIEYRDQKLPHCGLHYMTDNQQYIQEAKATLCVLASERVRKVDDINQLLT